MRAMLYVKCVCVCPFFCGSPELAANIPKLSSFLTAQN